MMNTLYVFVEKGKKIGLQEKTETVIRNLVRSSGLSDEQIASAAEVTGSWIKFSHELLP